MLPAVPSELVWTIYACILISKMMWQRLVGDFAFTGWRNIWISHNLWVLWQFSDGLVSHACSHENFTEYGEFSFCGAGEPSFWVNCYFTTVIATIFGFQFA